MELRDAIHNATPSLVELLKDVRWEVRLTAISTLGKFGEERESWPDIITLLILMDSGALW